MKLTLAMDKLIYHGDLTGDQIYLTFDDGPDPEWTPQVLDLLKAAAIRATFFVIGQNAVKHPQLIHRIKDEGHELGNHTWSHRHPLLHRSKEAQREVRDGAYALQDLTGNAIRWFRPPHGYLRQCMIDQSDECGQTTVLWSVSARDWGPFSSTKAISTRLMNAKAGDVLLMHDGHGWFNHPDQTSRALPELIEWITGRGLKLASLSTMYK